MSAAGGACSLPAVGLRTGVGEVAKRKWQSNTLLSFVMGVVTMAFLRFLEQ